MNKVVITADLSARLRQLTGAAFLADEAGATVAVYVPEAMYAELVRGKLGSKPKPGEPEGTRDEFRDPAG